MEPTRISAEGRNPDFENRGGESGEAEPLIELTHWVYDRGHRPSTRGWFHFFAAILGVIAGSVLATYAWMSIIWWQALGVTLYAVGVVVLFGVSAAYHLGPWRRKKTVDWWRRADHATIAVFIAATYTPFCLIALPPQTATWMLTLAWAGALGSVILNLVWIDHPRWLGTLVYLVIGWLIVPLVPQLLHNAGEAVLWLLLAGGIVYTLGALVYAFRWPGRDARWIGYHELFHLATIIAAVVHMVAVWMVVNQAAGVI
ncbi:hemeolysin-III related [Corynebacterium occultum]|uniref:Hemeolysin-III related n=1 Tax=Corynebacterium occultum TaxID=2675219 RepID=A0A6B8W8H4_9CORY|nr:hemolysin III family protein [Corynebacterium occultum]QGU08237.1 hemeolysin-III related [Corynebacterium occultum]